MNIEEQYLKLLQDILDNGHKKEDRTGVGTLSVYGRQIRHNMRDGFPLLTTKKLYWKGIVTELLWFLRGDTNIKFLVDNDCHIWDGDCFSYYQKEFKKLHYHTAQMGKEQFIDRIKNDKEFSDKFGDLGPIYGKQWRSWRHHYPKTYPEVSQYEQYIGVKTIDQIANLINDLKTNPDSRRLMVNAWDVGSLDQMALPPCHYGFQVWTRELTWEEQVQWVLKNTDVEMENLYIVEEIAKESTPKRAISLMWNQRSVDSFLGLPFNLASYALLLEILGEVTNMVPEELIGNLGDTHIYLNHVDAVKEQLTREPHLLPSLRINTEFWPTQSGECGIGPLHSDVGHLINSMEIDDFQIESYVSHSTIKAQLNN